LLNMVEGGESEKKAGNDILKRFLRLTRPIPANHILVIYFSLLLLPVSAPQLYFLRILLAFFFLLYIHFGIVQTLSLIVLPPADRCILRRLSLETEFDRLIVLRLASGFST
jgi:hypothetical protein